MGHQNLFVVVNRQSAKIFEVANSPESLVWLQTLKNPLGATKNKLMTNDKPGLSRGKFAKARSPHALTRERNPHEDAAIEFARKIALFIKTHQGEKELSRMTVAAEPHMMGLVKKALEQKPGHPGQRIRWLAKDLDKMTTQKLESFYFNPSSLVSRR
jgi:protein required for attachment to host cells